MFSNKLVAEERHKKIIKAIENSLQYITQNEDQDLNQYTLFLKNIENWKFLKKEISELSENEKKLLKQLFKNTNVFRFPNIKNKLDYLERIITQINT